MFGKCKFETELLQIWRALGQLRWVSTVIWTIWNIQNHLHQLFKSHQKSGFTQDYEAAVPLCLDTSIRFVPTTFTNSAVCVLSNYLPNGLLYVHPLPTSKKPQDLLSAMHNFLLREVSSSPWGVPPAQEDYVIKAMSRKWENKWSFRLKSISLDLHLFIYSDTSGGGGVELVLFRQGLSKISFAKNVLFYARRIHTSDHTNRGDLGDWEIVLLNYHASPLQSQKFNGDAWWFNFWVISKYI